MLPIQTLMLDKWYFFTARRYA